MPDIPKIEIGLFQYMAVGSLFSLQWVKTLSSFDHSKVAPLCPFFVQRSVL